MIQIICVHAFELIGCSEPCCVALGGVLRPSSVYKTGTQREGDLTCPARESILTARDGDNLLIQYGLHVLLSNMEADFLNGRPSFQYAL